MDAAEIARALKARSAGRYKWMARCPAHADKNPSLSISAGSDGKALVHCHAGCPQSAVIDALRALGLWSAGDNRPRVPAVNLHSSRDDDKVFMMKAALDIWNQSDPAPNTAVETYLRSRGITLPIPASLRFHSALRHTPTCTEWPAMVALITGADGTPIAVHRTYLAHDGNGKADVTPQKMTLGPCRGGAVRLGDIMPGRDLAIAEGIETALSVMQACQVPAWAALSAEGVKNIFLPGEVKSAIVAADNDVNGTGQRAAREAADRFQREGRLARITMPPDIGTDFNDLLLASKKEEENV